MLFRESCMIRQIEVGLTKALGKGSNKPDGHFRLHLKLIRFWLRTDCARLV